MNWRFLRAGGRNLGAVARGFSRPEVLAFLPAITLAAFWMGGESALILTALGLPMLFALAASIRRQDGDAGGNPAVSGTGRLIPSAQIVDTLDAALRAGPDTGRSTACLVLLIDEIGSIGERHGSAARAAVFRATGERLCNALRDGDLIAPIGADDGYAVALAPVQRLSLEGMIRLAARLQAAVAPATAVDAVQVYSTGSVGFCLGSRAPAPNGAALLEAALTAAEEAVLQGPGGIRAYQPDMGQRERPVCDTTRKLLETALDEGEIRPFFQAQISTETGEISGFEALVRWHHPRRGLLLPSEFLPAIDAAGMNDRLSEVVLQGALSAMARWEREGLAVPRVAVNFSAAELRNPALVDRLKWELDRFDLGPERLTVEVLESVVADTSSDMIVANIAALARLGCGVDLDDFGTGHASIAAIRRFAVRRIKIDRSFVTRLDKDREQQRIISAILSLAERLGIDTLAEGVETPGEQAMLAQLGCGHMQGFGIARPMPFEETAGWITSFRARNGGMPRLGLGSR